LLAFVISVYHLKEILVKILVSVLINKRKKEKLIKTLVVNIENISKNVSRKKEKLVK
jgi:hypothetical protein